MNYLLGFLFSISFALSPKQKGSEPELLLEGLGIPWSLEFLSRDRVIISEKSGKVKIFNLKSKKLTSIKGGPSVVDSGQGGLLDIGVDPEFAKTQRVFFSYSKAVKGGKTTAIASAKLLGTRLTELKDVFIANNSSATSHHYGSRIAFDDRGHIFFTVGDRGSRFLAQDLSADQGKVHRLNTDGSIPKDNPFYGRKNARKSIWSYGHRNPQGLYYHKQSGKLWEQEHGPRGGDEINLIGKGKNYGWPIITYGREYSGPKIGEGTRKVGMEQPVQYYVPSIAPCGLEIFKGRIYSGALKLTHINRLTMKGSKVVKEDRLLEKLQERVRDIKSDGADFIYFSTDSGKIFRLRQ